MYNAGYRDFSHFTIDVGDGFSDDDFGILRKCVFNDAKFRGILRPLEYFLLAKQNVHSSGLSEYKPTDEDMVFIADHCFEPSMNNYIQSVKCGPAITSATNPEIRLAFFRSIEKLNQLANANDPSINANKFALNPILFMFIAANDIEIVEKLLAIRTKDESGNQQEFFSDIHFIGNKQKEIIKNLLINGDEKLVVLLIKNKCITNFSYENVDDELQLALKSNRIDLASELIEHWNNIPKDVLLKTQEFAIENDQDQLYVDVTDILSPEKPYNLDPSHLTTAINNKAWKVARTMIQIDPVVIKDLTINIFSIPELNEQVSAQLSSIPDMLRYASVENRPKLIDLFVKHESLLLKLTSDDYITFLKTAMSFSELPFATQLQVCTLVCKRLEDKYIDHLKKLFSEVHPVYENALYLSAQSMRDKSFVIKMLKQHDHTTNFAIISQLDFKKLSASTEFKEFSDQVIDHISPYLEDAQESKREMKLTQISPSDLYKVLCQIIPFCRKPQFLIDVWNKFDFSQLSYPQTQQLINLLIPHLKDQYPTEYQSILDAPIRQDKCTENVIKALSQIPDLDLFTKALETSTKNMGITLAHECLKSLTNDVEKTHVIHWRAITALLQKKPDLVQTILVLTQISMEVPDNPLINKFINLFVEPAIRDNQLDFINQLNTHAWDSILQYQKYPKIFALDTISHSKHPFRLHDIDILLGTIEYIKNSNPNLANQVIGLSHWEKLIKPEFYPYDKIYASLIQQGVSTPKIESRQKLLDDAMISGLMKGNQTFLNAYLANYNEMTLFLQRHPEMDITKPEGKDFLATVLRFASPQFLLDRLKLYKETLPKFIDLHDTQLLQSLMVNSPLIVVKNKLGDQKQVPEQIKEFILSPDKAMKASTVDAFLDFLNKYVKEAFSLTNIDLDTVQHILLTNEWQEIINKAKKTLALQMHRKEITKDRYVELATRINTIEGLTSSQIKKEIVLPVTTNDILAEIRSESIKHARHILEKLSDEDLLSISDKENYSRVIKGDVTGFYVKNFYIDLSNLSKSNFKGHNYHLEKLIQLRRLLIMINTHDVGLLVATINSTEFQKIIKLHRSVKTLFSSSEISAGVKFHNKLLLLIHPLEQKEEKHEQKL